jgi:hypothetical protein
LHKLSIIFLTWKEREYVSMKTSNLLVAAAVTASMVAMPVTVSADFFPKDRQTYTCNTPTDCPGADHVTFNSFVNNPVVGDERPFLAGSLNGAKVADRIKVKDGDVITLRAYVHNNADATKTENTIARNVKMKVIVPTAKQKDTNLISFISADNATPKTINDTMSLYADSAFNVNYVPGTAAFTHAADGVNQKADKVSDNIVKDGASLGDIQGCFAYSGYVTLKVKVSMPTTPVTPPVTPPTTPPTNTPPTELVKTGPAQAAAIFAAVAAFSALAYNVVLRRQNAR